MRYILVLDVDAGDSAQEWGGDPEDDDFDERLEDDRESFFQNVEDGLTSVDMETAVAEVLEQYFTFDTVDLVFQDVRELEPKWRVQVYLAGKPARFRLTAPDRETAIAKVSEQLGLGGDWWVSKVYRLADWAVI